MKSMKLCKTAGFNFLFLSKFLKNPIKEADIKYDHIEPTTINCKYADDKLRELYPVSYAFIRYYLPLAIDLILDIRKMKKKVEMGFYDGTIFQFTECKPSKNPENDMCSIHMTRIRKKKIVLDCTVNEDWINEICNYIDEKDIKYITVDI